MNFHCSRGHIKTNIRILNKYAALKNKNTNRNPSRNISRGTSNPKVNMNDVEIDWVVGWISPLIHRSYSDHNIRRYRDKVPPPASTSMPAALREPLTDRYIFDLTEELIRRGYSDDNIRAVLGGNFRRLLAQVWG